MASTVGRPQIHYPPANGRALIYALYDPRAPQVVRYVGKTIKALAYRLINHVSEARKGGGSHKLHWIRCLLADGVQPGIRLLEDVDDQQWSERERYWVGVFRSHHLTNGNDGGKGGHVVSKSAREKLRQAQTGKKASPEARAAMRAAHLGKPLSLEHRKRLSEVRRGRKMPAGFSDKIRAAMLGRQITWRDKISAARRKGVSHGVD